MANIVIPAQTITKTITGSGDGQNVGSKKIVLNTKDTYVPENIEVNVSATVNVAAATLANAATSGQTYTENTANATIIPDGGALYINKGWINNTKITLGHMIPDDADYTNAGVAHIRAGFEAYNTDGNKLIGTMPDTDLSSSGGEMSGTLSVTGGTIEVTPKVTGTGVSISQGQTYGVTTTKPTSGTDGTHYLTFDPDATGGSVTNNGSITVTRAKVETSGIPGYYGGTTEELGSGTESFTGSATTSTSIKPGTNYYMPIVTITGTGGGVTKSSGSGSVTGTKPNVAVTYSGKFTELGTSGVGKNYGIIEGTPESGTDGTDYLSIVTTATPGAAQTWSGTATINYSRGEVKSNAAKAGAIKVTTSTSLLASITGSLTHSISGSVQATTNGATTYSIPIVTVTHGGGGVTATASGTEKTVAKATAQANITGKTSSGAAVTASNYGFEAANEDSATNGYITVYSSASSTTKPVITAKATANRGVVTYSNSAGAIIAHDSTTALSAASATPDTTDITGSDVTIAYNTEQRAYKIPIVSLVNKGKGGVVTVSANIPQDSIQTTVPTVTVSKTGSMTTTGNDAWGVTTTQPTNWTDGTSGVSITISSSKTNGSVSGSISGEYDRTAVTTSGNIKGAVSVSSSSPVTLLAAASNVEISNIGSFSSGDIVPTVSGASGAYYIPQVTTQISGGALTGDSTIACSSTGNFTCTPSVAFLSRSESTTGSAITLSTYGITDTEITSGSSVVFDPGGSLDATSRTVSASINVGRAAVTATISKGITKATTLTSNAVPNNKYTGSTAVTASVAAGTNYYVPVVSISKPTFGTASVTKPKVTMSSTASRTGSSTTVPTGVVTQSDAPNGWTNYITITPNSNDITNGSVSITSTVTVGKGLTAGGTQSENSTTNVGADTVVSNKTFIKIYDESYTIT